MSDKTPTRKVEVKDDDSATPSTSSAPETASAVVETPPATSSSESETKQPGIITTICRIFYQKVLEPIARSQDRIVKVEDEVAVLEGKLVGLEEKLEALQNDLRKLAAIYEATDQATSSGGARRQVVKPKYVKLGLRTKQSIDIMNCCEVFHIARERRVAGLLEGAREYIFENFYQVCENHAQIVKLSVDEMEYFVFSDSIRATEGNVFRLICAWADAESFYRRKHVSHLFSSIQLHRCPLSLLEEMEKSHHVQANRDFAQTVEQRKMSVLRDKAYPFHIGRIRWRCEDVMFVMGGRSSQGLVETFDSAATGWVVHNIPLAPRSSVWIASLEHQILVVDTVNGFVRLLHVIPLQWKLLERMSPVRTAASFALIEHQLYTTGGKGYGMRCDRFDIRNDRWEEEASMNCERLFASSTSLWGRVYCSGGVSESSNRAQSSVEVYHKEDRKWLKVPSMKVARMNHCLVSCTSFLWAVGGESNLTHLNSVEKFDPLTQQWTTLRRGLRTPRSRLSACFYGSLLYVTGGVSTTSDIPVEAYHPSSGEWHISAPLNSDREFHGSCVVKRLPEGEKYDEPLM